MENILLIIVVTTLHSFFSVILPGLYLERKITAVFSAKKELTFDASSFLFAVTLGFVFNFFEFLILYFLVKYHLFSQGTLVTAKYAIDVGILILFIVNLKKISLLKSWFHQTFQFVKEPVNLFAILFGCFIGLLGILNYPHVLDSAQVKWTSLFIQGLIDNIPSSCGAIGYSAIIYFPSVILQNIVPVVTVAVGFKLLLCVLLFLAAVNLTNKLPFSHKTFIGLTYLIILTLSSLGQRGLIDVGKDSIFGVAFVLMYMASLLDNKNQTTDYVKSAIFFTAAITTSSIAIPYLGIITLLYLISSNHIKPFYFIFCLLGISLVGLSIQINSMMPGHLIHFLIASLVLGTLCYAMRAKEIKISQPSFSQCVSKTVPLLSIVLMVIVCMYLMPIKLELSSGGDLDGHLSSLSFPPLDGKTSFLSFLFFGDFNLWLVVVGLGVLGMALYPFSKRFFDKNALMPFAIFPLFMILIVLLLAHLKSSPLSNFNLWDMIRDVMAWYGAVFFGLFALIFIDICSEVLTIKKLRLSVLSAACLVVVLGMTIHNRLEIRNFKHIAHFTKMGGDKNTYFAELTQQLALNKNKANLFLVPESSLASNMLYSYQMYTNVPVLSIAKLDRDHAYDLLKKLPILLVGNPSDIVYLSIQKLDIPFHITELHYFSESDESLFLLTKAEPNEVTHSPYEFGIISLDGFHNDEMSQGVHYKWVRKSSDYQLISSKKAKYLVTFDLFTEHSQAKTEINIYYQNKLLRHVVIDSNDPRHPLHVKLPIEAVRGPNIFRFESIGDEVKPPKDSRLIAYGVCFPLKVTKVM